MLANLSNQSVDHSQFNIVSPQFKANPFPLVASLRASQPVFRTALPDKTPVWLLTRYEDVATLLKDERFVKDKRKAMTAEIKAAQHDSVMRVNANESVMATCENIPEAIWENSPSIVGPRVTNGKSQCI